MPKENSLKRQASLGNVFADLALPDASEHLIKASLVLKIGKILRTRKLTQSHAAEILGRSSQM